jgi:hypothetical protein
MVLALVFTRGCATEVLAQRLARRTFKPGKGASGRLSWRPLHSSPTSPILFICGQENFPVSARMFISGH